MGKSKDTERALATEHNLADALVQSPLLSRVTDQLRIPQGPLSLATVDPRSTPGWPGKDKSEAAAEVKALAPRLADLQERLYAEGRSGGTRSVLLVLQGLDTSGKGGTVRHVIGLVDPQGCSITSFGRPSAEERRHEFLWRIKKALPPPGMIGVFDRSHYEDVVAVRVHNLASKATWTRRYATINRFEENLSTSGTRIVKCYLHISGEESRKRLLERLDDPSKHWKFKPSDIDERAFWPAYEEAYSEAMARCNSDAAPWYLVPADRKWYRNWAITRLLVEQLEEMALIWPAADFDVEEQKARLRTEGA